MRKPVKRLLALTLAALLVISMFACKQKDAGLWESGESTSVEEASLSESETRKNQKPPVYYSSEAQSESEVHPSPDTEGILQLPDEDDLSKTLDIYIVAGQSNANGSTKISSTSDAFSFAPELENGFSNVHYAGTARSDSSKNARDWQPVTLGLGRTSSHIGPEAGMAAGLADYYNEETGRHAGLIKLAHGGTSLLNKYTGSNAYGNWVPPSYAEYLKVNFANKTGGLYRALLEEIELRIAEVLEYDDYGFTSVRIMGLYWMQGCNDRSSLEQYRVALPMLVTDLRADLSELMKHMTGSEQDLGASVMPFVIGTISQTQNLSSESVEETNKAFIAQQKAFADPNSDLYVEECYSVDNSQFAISRYNPETGKAEKLPYATDVYHWGQADALEIGKNVGKLFLEILADAESGEDPEDSDSLLNDEYWTDNY